jgi:hypothetical protein
MLYVPTEEDAKLNEQSIKREDIKKESKVSRNLISDTKPFKTRQTQDNISTYMDSLKKTDNIKTEETEIWIEQSEEPIEVPQTNTPGVRTAKKRAPNTNESDVPATTLIKEKNSAPITQQIKLSESRANNGNYLTVYNNSSHFINFVAVDVFYYKAGATLIQKKTIYFNDLAAGTNLKLPVPDHKKSESVNYELGLISSEGGLYFARQ